MIVWPLKLRMNGEHCQGEQIYPYSVEAWSYTTAACRKQPRNYQAAATFICIAAPLTGVGYKGDMLSLLLPVTVLTGIPTVYTASYS